MNKKILVSTGIHNRDFILPYYLDHIYNLIYDKKLIDIYFIVNNCSLSDKSYSILQEFSNKYQNEYNSIKIDVINSKEKFNDARTNQQRESKTYLWLCEIRNRIFSKCVELGCDFLASIDSDVLVPQNLLNDLLSTEKSICSSLLYNGYLFAKSIDEAYKFPNILRRELNGTYTHIVNYYVKNPDKSPKDKLIECSATGACCIYSQDVCKNLRFVYNKQGEDIGLGEEAFKKGYKMYCLPYAYSQHIMSPSLLEQFKNF
jgi:hypothetical protein